MDIQNMEIGKYLVKTSRLNNYRRYSYIYRTDILDDIDDKIEEVKLMDMTSDAIDNIVQRLEKLKNMFKNKIYKQMEQLGYDTLEQYNRYINYLDKRKSKKLM